MKRITCGTGGHRMIEIVPGLYLCECSSYGPMAYLKGAEEAARRLVEQAGGLVLIRTTVEAAEALAKQERAKASDQRAEHLRANIRRRDA